MKESLSQSKLKHMVTLDNRKKIILTGIVEVISSTDKTVLTKTDTHLICINGEGLRIAKLNLEENILIVDGDINEFKYNVKSRTKNIFKRLIK